MRTVAVLFFIFLLLTPNVCFSQIVNVYEVFEQIKMKTPQADENKQKFKLPKFDIEIDNFTNNKLFNFFLSDETVKKREEVKVLQRRYKSEGKKLTKWEAKHILLLQNKQPVCEEDYHSIAKDIKMSKRKIEIPEVELDEFDKQIVNLPKHNYKIVKFNEDPGGYEIDLSSLKYKKQISSKALVSPDFTTMVFSSVYYYSNLNQAACEIFYLFLDNNLNKTDRILKAIKPNAKTIAFSGINKSEPDILRSFTPVDYNIEGNKVLFKEKIANFHDGLWKTNLFVYDFTSHSLYSLNIIHSALTYYLKKTKQLSLDDYRYNIRPLGWDKFEPNKILVMGYLYNKHSGEPLMFLGTWKIDYKGEKAQLIDLNTNNFEISINGYTLRLYSSLL